MQYLIIALVFLSGFFLPVQVALNSRLSAGLASPVRSTIISFAVGLVALLIAYATLESRLSQLAHINATPTWSGAVSVPWWAFLGGLCGAFYVLIAVVALPRLGAVAVVALALMGQQVGALMIDSFGLFGAPRISLTLPRVVGALLVALGVVLIQAKK
ncbi:MAG TPA: DMT family transporter [Capsulimonadaceae bacterium]|jgi:transporter family-2 protein